MMLLKSTQLEEIIWKLSIDRKSVLRGEPWGLLMFRDQVDEQEYTEETVQE